MLNQHHPVLSGLLKDCWSNNIGQYCICLNRALLHSLLTICFMTVSFLNRNIESVDASSMVQPDVGRKTVFDYFDFKQNVHHMTEMHQNIDNHWVSHMSTENRVSGNHLSSVRPKESAILGLVNGKFIPNNEEHKLQRENYATIVSRIIVRKIACLHFLAECAPKHIKHQYRAEMMKKTETVS